MQLVKRRLLIIILAIVVIGLGLVGYYLYGGSTVPNGQPPLVRLTDSNFSSLKDRFNRSANSVRVIVMLSPTELRRRLESKQRKSDQFLIRTAHLARNDNLIVD
jgi:hypothetical protein